MSTSRNNNHKSDDDHHPHAYEESLIINQNDSSALATGPEDKKMAMLADIENNVNSTENKSLSMGMLIHMILVVISSSTINGIVFGVVNNFGIFYDSLVDMFKADPSLLSLSGEKVIVGVNQTQAPLPEFLQPLIGKLSHLLFVPFTDIAPSCDTSSSQLASAPSILG